MIASRLRDLLVCPACLGPIHDSHVSKVLVCETCQVEYPVHDDIPIMLRPDLQHPTANGDFGLNHKAQQAAFSDSESRDEFGVVRPRGAPALYGQLMHEKFRRSVLGLEKLLPSSTVLVVCGGAGMDAEFLAQAGARVILSDISLGVVLQAQERSRRFGVDLALVVADAEALPFREASVDAAYVHDGLHHLEQPALGLGEMARVARRAISVNEPASALATTAAIRLGLAQRVEEAGNRVMRLTLDEIVEELIKHSFRPIRPHRYGMFYRHRPGAAMHALSRPKVLPLAVGGLALANRILGRFGNKLTVQAIRVDQGAAQATGSARPRRPRT